MRKVLKGVVVQTEGDKVVVLMGVDRLELSLGDAQALSVDLRIAVGVLTRAR